MSNYNYQITNSYVLNITCWMYASSFRVDDAPSTTETLSEGTLVAGT